MANIVSGKKWVGVSTDVRLSDALLSSGEPARDQFLHMVQNKYLTAVRDCMDAIPVAIPSYGLSDPSEAAETCSRLDGLLFTGAISNVHPTLYGTDPSPSAEPYDQLRDATTFPLMSYAMESGLPLFCICRGFQEFNVAHGGTLHPLVHEVEGRMDHRRPKTEFIDIEYGPHHQLLPTEGSLLEAWLAEEGLSTPPQNNPPMINSLHLQSVAKLGEGLVVEGTAPDGTVEAMRSETAAGFNYAVQWHPEFDATRVDLSRLLFARFAQELT